MSMPAQITTTSLEVVSKLEESDINIYASPDCKSFQESETKLEQLRRWVERSWWDHDWKVALAGEWWMRKEVPEGLEVTLRVGGCILRKVFICPVCSRCHFFQWARLVPKRNTAFVSIPWHSAATEILAFDNNSNKKKNVLFPPSRKFEQPLVDEKECSGESSGSPLKIGENFQTGPHHLDIFIYQLKGFSLHQTEKISSELVYR
jgi:hypothetical protein